jgi:hypothetical protein
MTLYDLIMGAKFGKSDWAALGRGDIMDEETIGQMLMEGYKAVVSDE